MGETKGGHAPLRSWLSVGERGRRRWSRCARGGGVGKKRRMVVTSPLKNTRSSYRSVQLTKHEHNKSDYL
jgi:hypothetical protein